MKSRRIKMQRQSKNERKRQAYVAAKDKKHFSRYALKQDWPYSQTAKPCLEKTGHSFVCPWCKKRENGKEHICS